MATIILKGHFDGKNVILDEPYPLAVGQEVIVRTIDDETSEGSQDADSKTADRLDDTNRVDRL